MLLAKKYLLSFLFIVSLGILQFNTLPLIQPVSADSTLLNNQTLLKESTANNYGNSPKDVKVIALKILQVLLTFIGLLVLGLLLMSGFQYMTSAGNDAKLKEAMGRIQAAVIGLIIILMSWGITTYMIKWLVCATNGNGGNCGAIW